MTTTTTSPPATPAALVRADPRGVTKNKRSLDELDDDDLALIGQAQRGESPRRRLRLVGAIVAGAGAAALGSVAGPVVGGLVCAVAVLALFSGARRDCAADLKDAGIDDALADELGRAAGDRGNALFNFDAVKIVPHLAMPKRELVRLGQRVVDDVKRRRT